MAVINGTAINFGFTGSNGIAITGLSGTLLQSLDHSKGADVESVRNGLGDIVSRGWYDLHDEATIEWVITGTGLANAITNTTLSSLTPGAFIVVTACASDPDVVATWEVQSGAKITGSNTNAKRISVPVHKRAGVTAVASA